MLEKVKSASKTAAQKAMEGAGKAAATARSRSGKGKQTDQFLVALDVGTEFVKALIGKVNEAEGTVEIVGVGRAHQGLTDMQAGAISDIAAVVENCDKALNQAEEQSGISVRQAIIGIAGELVKGTTTTIRVARKQSNKALDIPEMEKDY